MFMSVLDNSLTSARYEDLAGARIALTGLTAACGVDVARAFADHKARLVLQSAAPAADPEMTAVVAMLAETASEIKLFDAPLRTSAAAQKFAQTEGQVYGGIDALINLVPVSVAELAEIARQPDIETAIARKLETAMALTRVAANRMRVMLTEGLILNVLVVEGPVAGHEALVAGMMRATLAAMTRIEAEKWAGNGIRINAIGPRVALPGDRSPANPPSEPEIAAVALYLASSRARGLSGHVFQAEGVLTKCE